MKRFTICLFILSLLLCEASHTGGGAAFAASSGSCGDNATYTLSDAGVLTISGIGRMTNFTNATTVPWKDSRSSITSIVIESGITSIGTYAFYNCSTAVSIRIPVSIDSIGNNAFNNNVKFTDKVYYEGTLAQWCAVKMNGATANPFFYQYSGSTPSPKFRINGTEVTKLDIPEGVTSVGAYCFYGLTNISSVTIPTTVTYIGKYAFYNNTNVATVTFTETSKLDSIATYAFYGCNKSTFTKIVFPASLRKIEERAFQGCSYLATIDFSKTNKLKTIGNYAFYQTTALTAIDLRGATALTSIGNYAFALSSSGSDKTDGFLYTPSNLTSIGNSAFRYRSGIDAIVIMRTSTTDLTVATSSSFDGMTTSIPVYVYKYSSVPVDRLVTSYSSATGWSTFSNFTCENSVTWNCGTPTASALVAKLDLRNGSLTFTGSGAMKDYGKTSDKAPWLDALYKTVLKSVTISNMTSVGNFAFYLCSHLTGSISFNSSITSIGSGAFWGCTGLTGLNFNSATSLATIHDNAFYNCYNVTSSIKLPASLTTMETCAFQNCKAITGLTFAEGFQLTTIPTYAFQNCIKMAGKVTIPSSVTAIDNYAFQNCSTVVALNLMNATELTSIGTYAFQYMSSVDGLLYIPSKVTSLGTYAFAGMTSIDGIVAMPTTPPTAGSAYTFNSIDKSIPVYVKDATAEGKYKAESCTGWKDFTNYKYETDPQQCGDELYWQFRFSTNRVIFTGSGDMWDYDNSSNKAPWRTYNDILKYVDYCNDMTSIGNYAFYQCSNYIPSNLTIKANIQSIGQYAFYQCPGITSLSFANGSELTTLGLRAFYGCSAIKTVTLPEGLEVIPNYCFAGCSSLTNIKIPSTLTTIGNSTFENCTALKNIDLPASITTLDSWAFHSCSSIEYIKCNRTTPPTATSNSFSGINTSTTYVSVPDGSEDAYCAATGWSAFCGKTGQEIGGTTGDVNWILNFDTHRLTIYGSGDMAGYGSSGFTLAPWLAYTDDIHEVEIEENVTNVGTYAFYHAMNLTKVTLPSTITYVGDYAFSGDVNINTIFCAASSVPEVRSHSTYQSGITYISSAFASVQDDIVVVVPLSSISTYKSTGVVNNSLSLTGWNYFTSYHATGTCGSEGDNLIWDYADATTTLTISGEGAMADYATTTAMPWNSAKTLISSLAIENGVTTIGKNAFYGCTAITSLNDMPNSLTTIGYCAFRASGLTNLTIPRNVTTVGEDMARDCGSLSAITWNAVNCTTYVGSGGSTGTINSTNHPFWGSTTKGAITSFTFGEEAEVIPPYLCASMNNEAFTSITIPASVTSIGANAFNGCTNLASVTSNATTPPTIASNSFASPSTKKLYLPHDIDVKAAYRAADYWSEFTEANTFPKIVQFDLQEHGDDVDPQFFDNITSKASEPSDPSVANYDFGGWYEEEECETAFNFGSTTITTDWTLYAQWTKLTRTFTDASGDGKWSTAGNWSGGAVPTINYEAIITKPVTVDVTTAKAYNVVIDQNSNTGKLTIDAGKELVVATTVKKTTDGSSYTATGEDDIVILSDGTNGLGALVMGSHDGTNKATVHFYTITNGENGKNTSVAQYLGTPFSDETNILHNWYNSWIYGIEYKNGAPVWKRVNGGEGMAPFAGYCVFSADGVGHVYDMSGTLVSSDDKTLTSLHWQSDEGVANPNNENLLANSWMAPIKINAIAASDFTDAEATIYIFNAGSGSTYSFGGNYATYTPGSADDKDVIPSMQSFSVFTTGDAGSLTLDYSTVVYAPAVAGTTTVANFAPKRNAAADDTDRMRLYVKAESGYGDMLYLLENANFSDGFENGWDAHKMTGESEAPQLCAPTADGDLAISCVPDWEGTVLGFRKGTADDSYTFTFGYSGSGMWYLNDQKEQTSTFITQGGTYTFAAADDDAAARFVISATPIAHTPTAVEDTERKDGEKINVRKMLIDGTLYIIRNGRMYDTAGLSVR